MRKQQSKEKIQLALIFNNIPRNRSRRRSHPRKLAAGICHPRHFPRRQVVDHLMIMDLLLD